jgi:uncharacterized membrane protein
MTVIAAELYDWLVLLHILAAMIWVGGIALLGVYATLLLRSGEQDPILRFVRSLRVIGPLVLAPATIGVVAFGVWLVLDSNAWSFEQTWIWLALGLFGAAFLVGAVFQSRAAIGAQRAAEAGRHDEAALQLRRWTWGMRLILLILLVIAWDMVFKPGS